MTDELKPVPCGCGGEEHVVRYSVKDWDLNKWVPAFYVKCKKCGIRTIDYPTEAEAIEAWNRAMGADKNSIVSVFSSVDIAKIDSVTPKYQGFGDGEKLFAYGYICPNCKGYVREGDKYCAQCGMKLEWGND